MFNIHDCEAITLSDKGRVAVRMTHVPTGIAVTRFGLRNQSAAEVYEATSLQLERKVNQHYTAVATIELTRVEFNALRTTVDRIEPILTRIRERNENPTRDQLISVFEASRTLVHVLTHLIETRI